MKADLWKKIDELFAATMASFVQQHGTSLMESRSRQLNGRSALQADVMIWH
jgi:hypothetical protein